jgi:hypothetical protein
VDNSLSPTNTKHPTLNGNAEVLRSECLHTFEERCEFRRRPELRNRIELLKRRRERILQAPQCSRRKFLDRWIEVQVKHPPSEVLRCFEIPLDERTVDHELGRFVLDPTPPPQLYLALHGLETSLHPVHPDRNGVHKTEAFGVLCEHPE